VNHGSASEWGGGDSVQIQETAKRLVNRGHRVSIQNADQPEIDDVDIVHIFNCRVHSSFSDQMNTCMQAGKPVVISPIWISIGRAIWGSRGSLAVLEKAINGSQDEAARGFELIRERKLVVNLGEYEINSYGQSTNNMMKWQVDVAALLKKSNGILTNSWLELKSLQLDLNWCGDNYEVAHYGVDSKIFLDADPKHFQEYTGIKGQFIMQAGRIEPAKNQAMLCWALRDTNLPIVLVGSSKKWPSYAELCKKISGEQLTIIDHLPQSMLSSAYAAARVHCLVSWMDTCGLVSLEAALNGTPLVGSTFGHELEYLENDGWLADPGDPMSIKNAVLSAWNAGKNSKKSQTMKRKCLERFNWEKTVDKTEKFYKSVI